MALKRLDWDGNYDVTDDSPDIRGWSIHDTAGGVVGKIKDLLFEPSDNRVYYAVADVDGRNVQIPVSEIDVDDSSRAVRLRSYDRSRLGTLDVYDETRTYDTPVSDVRGDRLPKRLQLLEEQLRIGKRSTQVGEAVIGKKPVVEQVQEDVTLVKEELEINRRPVNEPVAGTDRISATGETIKVALFSEEPVVEKKTFVKEEVEIGKRQETRTETVRDEVRHEELTFAGTEPSAEDIRQREIREGRLVEEDQVNVLPKDDVRRDGLL